MDSKLKLNKKNEKLFRVLCFFIFAIFVSGSIYFVYQVLFPSEYFTQSFQNINSLKNTITDVSQKENSISFFASTSQDFSEIKMEIKLEKKSVPIENSYLELKKSYKSFFYPKAPPLDKNIILKENLLVSSADSYFIVGKDKKNPIDNPSTLTGLGYSFDNRELEEIDLGEYEKDKLLNITSTHPDGTILVTDENNYYLIEDGFKKKIDNSLLSSAENYKNNIFVQETSLKTQENCQLENNLFFKKKYHCTIATEKISQFSGKDYRFELSDIPEEAEIQEINLEFKKTLNKNNLFIFIADVKNKVRARFTGEKL